MRWIINRLGDNFQGRLTESAAYKSEPSLSYDCFNSQSFYCLIAISEALGCNLKYGASIIGFFNSERFVGLWMSNSYETTLLNYPGLVLGPPCPVLATLFSLSTS
ncbi:hypothetical protein [Legionella pneumophila]|uniref:hypothetical protein n=1 Tax=Legionella pneumophila TaxID=446 RepID=UPI0010AAAC28|nr:hypothetical protein [Legionella pneumophila]HAT8949643.1 hypothetical protein [Legionella pneumophila subsp. pneumophila]HAU0257012.1 hypothetical protein [Legionella pneumophila]